MDLHELGAFLRSRRERLRPADVGMPASARRRTSGLRREEVAVLAHISTEYYVRLEQGRAPRPSGEVLGSVGDALLLTDQEVDHLHALAGATRRRVTSLCREVRPTIRALLDRLPLTAGFVMSADFEVLAWNRLAAALMDDFAGLEPDRRNLARRAFLDAETAHGGLFGLTDGTEFRQHVVMQLHVVLGRHPDDAALRRLVGDLLDGSQEFARLWDLRDVQPRRMLTKTFRHPVVGPVTVDCDTLTLPDTDQQLVLHTAPPDSHAAQALALLDVVTPERSGSVV